MYLIDLNTYEYKNMSNQKGNAKNICEICGVRARYNTKNETIAKRCFNHKEINMIDIKSQKCVGCNKKTPAFNYIKEKKPLYCKTCKLEDMVDIKSKKCINCKIKIRTFNYKNESIALYCGTCKLPGMINITNKKCILCNEKQPNYNFKTKKPEYCFDCKLPDMIDLRHALCKKCNETRATFNKLGEKEALYCKNCKDLDMVDIKNKKCILCKIKICSFNFETEKTPLYCNTCKLPNMINIKDKKCIKCNSTRPTFNTKGENEPLYCKNCKDSDMVDVKSKMCLNCKQKRPNYNYQESNELLYCFKCKLPGMINITSKKCISCKNKIALFNIDGENNALFCLDCKKHDMINIKSKKCCFVGCKKNSCYNLPGVIPHYCRSHRTEGMIKNPRKKCLLNICNNIATHGNKTPEHCEDHALPDEYNLAERKCPECGNIDILNKQGICVNTCSLLEIDRCIKKRVKKHEESIGKLLKQHIDTSKLIQTWQDQIIDQNCTKKRPDFVFHCGTHVVIVEVDEDQHKSYSNCGTTKDEKQVGENRRMYEIANTFIGLPVIFLRYNPDSYIDTNGKRGKIPLTKRQDILIKWVQKCITNNLASSSSEKISNLRVKYLFYDGFNETDSNFVNIYENDII
jgi:hypothetical protein